MDRVRELLRQKNDELLEFCPGCEFWEVCEPEVGRFLEGA